MTSILVEIKFVARVLNEPYICDCRRQVTCSMQISNNYETAICSRRCNHMFKVAPRSSIFVATHPNLESLRLKLIYRYCKAITTHVLHAD